MKQNTSIAKQESTAPVSAQAISTRIINRLTKDIGELVSTKQLDLPEGYSYANALRSAWLIIQDLKDKSGKPTIQQVSEMSVYKTLYNMLIQGLDMAQQQGYAIAYGNELTFQRSVYGDLALLERAMPGARVYKSVIREGETFDFAFDPINQTHVVERHTTSLESLDKPIVGAYAGIVTKDGQNLGVVVMTWEQIQQSWKKSKTAHFETSVHKEFPAEMALRTVQRNRLKSIIRADTKPFVRQAIEESEREEAQAHLHQSLATRANSTALAIETSDLSELEPNAVTEAPEAQEQ